MSIWGNPYTPAMAVLTNQFQHSALFTELSAEPDSALREATTERFPLT